MLEHYEAQIVVIPLPDREDIMKYESKKVNQTPCTFVMLNCA
jgi:hypothetical protein